MNKIRTFLVAALATGSAPALAHVGSHNMQQHFVEHLLLSLAIGLVLGLGIKFLFKRGSDRL